MLRIFCWMGGWLNDRFTEVVPAAAPARIMTRPCRLRGCGCPAYGDNVLCGPHLRDAKLGYYDPDTGFREDS